LTPSDGGSRAQATFVVNCWGKQSFSTGNRYRNGTVEVHGGTAKFRFFTSGLKYGVTEWSEGVATIQNTKLELRFPKTTMKLSSNEYPSAELIFR